MKLQHCKLALILSTILLPCIVTALDLSSGKRGRVSKNRPQLETSEIGSNTKQNSSALSLKPNQSDLTSKLGNTDGDVGPPEKQGVQLYESGIRPFKGVVVPDDMVLPKGYSRYYRTRDDGTVLPPVLVQQMPDGQSKLLDAFPSDILIHNRSESSDES